MGFLAAFRCVNFIHCSRSYTKPLTQVHACRKNLNQPCSTAVETCHAIVTAAARWRISPLHQTSHGADETQEQVDQMILEGLKLQYDPDSPPNVIVRKVYAKHGQISRANRLPQYQDLIMNPWAAGCLQVVSHTVISCFTRLTLL